MSPEERDRFQRFHGHSFPPLEQRDAWIWTLLQVRPFLSRFEAEKEWQNRMINYAEWQIQQRKETPCLLEKESNDKECEVALRSILGAEAALLVVLNESPPGSGFSMSFRAHALREAMIGIPNVLRGVADQIEADFRSVKEMEKLAQSAEESKEEP